MADLADVTGRWDRVALIDGALVSLVFAVPPTIIARVLAGEDATSGWSALVSLAAVVGFFLGGGVAAWLQQCRTPYLHGLAASGGVFLVVQAVFLLVILVTGGDVRPGRIVASFTLTCVAGLLGAMAGSALQSRGVRPRPRT